MGNYKIEVNIGIVECSDGEGTGCLENNGFFAMTIGEKDAESIDQCESCVLSASHEAIREALTKHLEAMSKKKLRKSGARPKNRAKPKTLQNRRQAGRLEFATHSVFDGSDKLVFNSAADFYPALGSKEYYRTVGFKEIAYIYGDTEKSFRKTADLLNRIRHQQIGGTPFRTLQESTEREGGQIVDLLREKAWRCLHENGFDEIRWPCFIQDDKNGKTISNGAPILRLLLGLPLRAEQQWRL